jgi:hypothetical protein
MLDTCIETLKEVDKITDNRKSPAAFEETALAKWPEVDAVYMKYTQEFEERDIGYSVDLNLKVGEVRQALPHGRNDTDNFEPATPRGAVP